MRKQRYRRSYQLHDLCLVIAADHVAPMRALHARLEPLAREDLTSPDILHIEFSSVMSEEPFPVSRPPGAGRLILELPKGEVLYFEQTDQLYIDYADQVRLVGNLEQGVAQLSLRLPNPETLWLATHSLFTILLVELLKRRGYYYVHSAGLSWHEKGIILPGTSGSGKSTLTLSLLRAGFGFLGDDTIWLATSPAASQPARLRLLAFPEPVDVTEQTLGFFPELHPLLQQPKSPGAPKWQLSAQRIFGAAFVQECQPALLIFPQIAHKDKSMLTPLDKDQALLELVPNVLLTEPHSTQLHLDQLAQLVRQSDCYRLQTGTDWAALPRLVRELVE